MFNSSHPAWQALTAAPPETCEAGPDWVLLGWSQDLQLRLDLSEMLSKRRRSALVLEKRHLLARLSQDQSDALLAEIGRRWPECLPQLAQGVQQAQQQGSASDPQLRQSLAGYYVTGFDAQPEQQLMNFRLNQGAVLTLDQSGQPTRLTLQSALQTLPLAAEQLSQVLSQLFSQTLAASATQQALSLPEIAGKLLEIMLAETQAQSG